MAKIAIGDLTGSAQIDAANDTFIGEQGLSNLKTAATAVIAALPKPVTDSPFEDASFAATFENSTILLQGNTADIKESVNCTISVARRTDSSLFGADSYDPVTIKDAECWAGFELDTLLDASVAVPLPQGFGVRFEASTAAAFSAYSLIPAAKAPTTSLSAAISKALNNFRILASSDAVLGIPQDVIYTTDITGTVTVGGSWTLPLAVNQLSLADARLPFNKSVSVVPSVTLSVGGSIALTGEFSVRVRKVAADLLRIGVYKKKATTLTASLTAGAGVAANLGNTDLVKGFFSAVAPSFDLSGMQTEDVAKIRKVLGDSINQSLSISLNAACAATNSDEAAIVYEVNTAAADLTATKSAIADAWRGSWTGLAGLANAKPVRNLIRETVERKYTVNVNILGLYNYRSVSDFVRSMRIVSDGENGSVVITDTATATRITTASAPLLAAPDKLRAALYSSFVATATYQALGAGVPGVGATFGATQTLLIYKAKTDYRDALKQLYAGRLLGVIPVASITVLPAIGGPVHQARFAASCTYSNDDVLRFFFGDIQAFTPRAAGDVKKIGRTVLASLLDPQSAVDQQRILYLTDDSKWAQIDANPAAFTGVSGGDWLDITEWAEAVAGVAPALGDAIAYGKTVAGNPAADAVFMSKRHQVALAVESVTRKAKAPFKPTFPICVMATLAGRTPGTPPPVFEAMWDSKTYFSNKSAPMAAAAVVGGHSG